MSECRTIALTNQKGGVGKTTTTMHLGIGLANQGYRVLLIDGDPQANLTMSFGYEHPEDIPNNICGILRNEINDVSYDLNDFIIHLDEGADLISSSIELSGLETQLVSAISRESLFKGFIKKIKNDYDYILIDCQPSLGVLTLNSLVASDSVIIPTQAHYFSVKGLELLMKSITKVRQSLNPTLKIDGIVMTMVNERTNITKEIIATIRETYGRVIPVFNARIPYSIKMVEASANGESAYSESEKNKLSEAYKQFTREVIEVGQKQRWQDRTDSLR